MNNNLETLKEMLNKTAEDKELFYWYQSSIAMSVYDALRTKKKGKPYLTNKEIHEACNQGAVNFLQLWNFSNEAELPSLPPIK